VRPHDIFWSPHYLRHNQRRQEHLATLGLPLANRTVLEVGAGIGDHTSFFLDRGCSVVVSEPRPANLDILRSRYPSLDVRALDLDEPPDEPITAEVVYCYGTLYHLERPAAAIRWMARSATDMLLLETCVAPGDGERLERFEESRENPDNAVNNHGCRPTRDWVWRELGENFAHVCAPTTQPWHEEFPTNWTDSELPSRTLIRSVFVASHTAIASPSLVGELPTVYTRS